MDRAIYRFLGLAALLVLLPWLVYPVFLMKILCFALFACAFNLLLGFGGLLSFGHAVFLATAGYAVGHSVKTWGFTPELGLLFAVALTALLGAAIGALAIRRQGIYFAMITLALSQLMAFVFLQAPFTGGEDGLQGVPRGRLFGLIPLDHDLAMYAVVAVLFLAGYALIHRIVHSPFGEVLRASRENEARAISLGYDVDRFKLLAFTLSAALSGLAGALKTLVLGFEVLSDAHWHMSGQVVLMTLVGGMGTLFGPVVGAATMVSIESGLADKVGSWVQVIMGVTFVACVLGFRRGVVGELAAWWERRQAAARQVGFSSGRKSNGTTEYPGYLR